MTGTEGSPVHRRGWADRRFMLAYALIISTVVVVLLVFGYLNARRLESIDDRLRYRPPSAMASADLAIPTELAAAGQVVYVPVYSHVYARGGRPFLLETTLSIRNVNPDHPITVVSVRYYDTAGKLVKQYLSEPLGLAPLATTEFVVEQRDSSGGSGANFLVEWVADREVHEPIIEAVMVGFDATRSVSFVCPGRVIEEKHAVR